MVIVSIILGSLLKLVCVFVLAQVLKRSWRFNVVSALLHPFLCFHIQTGDIRFHPQKHYYQLFLGFILVLTCLSIIPLSESYTGSWWLTNFFFFYNLVPEIFTFGCQNHLLQLYRRFSLLWKCRTMPLNHRHGLLVYQPKVLIHCWMSLVVKKVPQWIQKKNPIFNSIFVIPRFG